MGAVAWISFAAGWLVTMGAGDEPHVPGTPRVKSPALWVMGSTRRDDPTWIAVFDVFGPNLIRQYKLSTDRSDRMRVRVLCATEGSRPAIYPGYRWVPNSPRHASIVRQCEQLGFGNVCGDPSHRAAAVSAECCDEPAESTSSSEQGTPFSPRKDVAGAFQGCSAGYPGVCNLGCATVFLKFWEDCLGGRLTESDKE
eukprot:COSAG01_NODE_19844_length_986_cov_0.925592_2_plen_196_part_01